MKFSRTIAAIAKPAAHTELGGAAKFTVFVSEIADALPRTQVAARINIGDAQFEATKYIPKIERDRMPVYPVGSLFALFHAGACTHIGTITQHIPDNVAPSFGVVLLPMCKEVRLDPRRIDPKQPYRSSGYAYAATTADGQIIGAIRRLDRQEADFLRALIGPHVPEAMLQTYWSDAERMALQAEAKEAQRFRTALAALLKQLEQAGAHA